jgi:hypothetical protein
MIIYKPLSGGTCTILEVEHLGGLLYHAVAAESAVNQPYGDLKFSSTSGDAVLGGNVLMVHLSVLVGGESHRSSKSAA